MLQFEQLNSLLSCNDIVSHEETLYQAVINWVNYDVNSRAPHLTALLSHVKFIYMKQDYLLKILEKEPHLQTNAGCKDLVNGALLAQQYKNSLSLSTPRPRPLQLFVCGGFPSDNATSVTMYDFNDECWRELAGLDEGRAGHGVGVVGGKVYIVGGVVSGSISASCVMYDLVSNTWSTSLANMGTPRAGHGVAVVKNCI